MEDFTENIKEWVKIDNEIQKIYELLREKRVRKAQILEKIMDYKTEKNLENTNIKISDGYLKFTQYRQYQSLNFTYLYECLNKLFDEDRTKEIIKHIKTERTYKIIEDMKRS